MSKDKRQKAVQLLAKGLNQSEVAKKLGVTRQAVSYWWRSSGFKEEVEAAKAKIKQVEEPQVPVSPELPVQPELQSQNGVDFSREKSSYSAANSLRDYYFNRELRLLNNLENVMMPHALEGSVRAAGLLLKLSERRSKLLNLDLPVHSEVEALRTLVGVQLIPEEMAFEILQVFDKFQASLHDVLTDIANKYPSSPTNNTDY